MSQRPLRALAIAAICSVSLSLPSALAAPFDQVEVRSETALSDYQKVYIAPVAVTLEEPDATLLSQRRNTSRYIASQRPVSDDNQSRKSDELHADLTRSFAKDFILVNEPGQDVLTVSAEITKLIPSRPTPEERKRGVGNLQFAGSVSPGGVDYTVTFSAGEDALVNIQEVSRANLNDGFARNSVWYDVDRSFNRFSRQLAKYVKSN